MYGFGGSLSVAVVIVLLSRVSLCLPGAPQKNVMYASWNPEHKRTDLHDNGNRKYAASGEFTNEINKTGWATLVVTTDAIYPGVIQAYAAGLVEGSLTANLVNLSWNNTLRDYCPQPYSDYCTKLRDFLQRNLDWVKEQITAAKDVDAYWYQVKLFLIQLKGVEDGVSGNATGPSIDVDPFGLYLANLHGDLGTLAQIFGKTPLEDAFLSGQCSVLIKLLPGNADLFVSHNTWTEYNTMLRINKRYILNYRLSVNSTDIIPGNDVAFSSYPARLSSGDDFYISKTGLAMVETTFGNGNSSLWKYVTANGTVMEEIRNAVANRLATDGLGWARTFSRYNSGTYNNEWMIVDYKKFTPKQPLKPGTLFVLDQLPGHIEYNDLTTLLEKQTYFRSNNLPNDTDIRISGDDKLFILWTTCPDPSHPLSNSCDNSVGGDSGCSDFREMDGCGPFDGYFPDIFNMSGLPAMVAKYGDFFSYDMAPRSLIFQRDQGNVTDMTSMMKIMRYNNFQNDPLSRCNCTPPYSGENAISARSDLNPANGTYPFSSLGHRPHGATDMKVTSCEFISKMQYMAQCGPTFDQEPPFQWSTSDFRDNISHAGQPDLFKFDPVLVVW